MRLSPDGEGTFETGSLHVSSMTGLSGSFLTDHRVRSPGIGSSMSPSFRTSDSDESGDLRREKDPRAFPQTGEGNGLDVDDYGSTGQ